MTRIIHLGFTGTRIGMSLKQKERLIEVFENWIKCPVEIHWHHGACEGADIESDVIARNHGCIMHIHPSNHKLTRIHCEEPGDTVYREKPPLVRDHDIVEAIEVLYAAPKDEKKEVQRSGTWATVRYARATGTRFYLLER
jgi:hypothetical protein